MKPKFIEILLAAAIAFTTTDWYFRDGRYGNGYHNPNDLLEGQSFSGNSFSTFHPNQQLPSITQKEEQNILDTIINLEESQQQRAVVRPITNFFAYPLVSQNSDGQSYESDSDTYSPPVHGEARVPQERLGSPLPASPNSGSWVPSPPSPIDDGGLFGAIGYAPWSNNQYFDIDTFLNADMAPELIDQDFDSLNHDSLFATLTQTTDSWIDKSAEQATEQQAESLEELASFLEDAIESPTSTEMQKKDAAAFDNMKKLMPSSQTSLPQNFDGLFESSTTFKRKVNPIADIRSYNDIRGESLMKSTRVKLEVNSPHESDNSWGKSSDNEFSGYASSSSSSHGSSQSTKKRSKSSHNEKIWLDLPYTKGDLINTKIEDFNDIISKLEPLQQHIAKDIRRKGKNKLAARNCRKRKLDVIDGLGSGLSGLEQEKQMLLDEKLQLQLERDEIIRKTEFLYEHIFKNLRDERGQLYSKENYALTYTVDGSVYLVPKKNSEEEQVKL